jgi:hypothetical protein
VQRYRVGELDGKWDVKREGGLLPPMVGVRKEIAGSEGVTTAGPLRFAFTVEGRSLRYRFPPGLVDELEPDGDGYRGRAFFAGRELGRFRLERAGATRER